MKTTAIAITRSKELKALPDEGALGFGHYFTDHMFLCDWTAEKGWHGARIVPYGPLTLSPAATVFHYGAEIFEGMKAYRTDDGRVLLFRPEDNFARLNSSAVRMSLPHIDPDFALGALCELLALDARWVPRGEGTALYIRPFMMAVDGHLGIHGYDHVIFSIIMSPSGGYFSDGFSAVRIMIEDEDVRAVRGGTGYVKCGGNYGGSMRATARAAEKGCSQVLWLDGVERRYVEEVGSMNVMFLIGDKVVTPELRGTVLPGVTRRSCIQLCRDWGYEVEERLLSADELLAAAGDGSLKEAWGCGTAAVISPIGALVRGEREYSVSGGEPGELSERLFSELYGIQRGRCADIHHWTYEVTPAHRLAAGC